MSNENRSEASRDIWRKMDIQQLKYKVKLGLSTYGAEAIRRAQSRRKCVYGLEEVRKYLERDCYKIIYSCGDWILVREYCSAIDVCRATMKEVLEDPELAAKVKKPWWAVMPDETLALRELSRAIYEARQEYEDEKRNDIEHLFGNVNFI